MSVYPGKGTQAPRIKEKYCVCHLVCSSFEGGKGSLGSSSAMNRLQEIC